ncbi:hypothetical protein Q2941_21970 [Bradyrhizobium sp. UFLA05-153]
MTIHPDLMRLKSAFDLEWALPERARWISLSKSISPVSERLAQGALNLNPHVIRSVFLGGGKSHADNSASFKRYPL